MFLICRSHSVTHPIPSHTIVEEPRRRLDELDAQTNPLPFSLATRKEGREPANTPRALLQRGESASFYPPSSFAARMDDVRGLSSAGSGPRVFTWRSLGLHYWAEDIDQRSLIMHAASVRCTYILYSPVSFRWGPSPRGRARVPLTPMPAYRAAGWVGNGYQAFARWKT